MAAAIADGQRRSRQRLRKIAVPAYAIVAILLVLSLTFIESPVPRGVRAIAAALVLVLGLISTEAFVRLAVRYYPDGVISTPVAIVLAEVGSLIGFGAALGTQAALGYVSPITWTTVLEATVSGPIWILAVGNVVAARWRYLTDREGLLDEIVEAESVRQVEGHALVRARAEVAESVRPSLSALRGEIDAVLTGADDPTSQERMGEHAVSLRQAASDVVRPLSHRVYANSEPAVTAHRPLRFVAAIVRTQPFRPLLVSLLYVAAALPATLEEYGALDGGIGLAIDVVFIVLILGGANLAMRRWARAHGWIYVVTLVMVHAIPLLLTLPGVAETDPQTTVAGKVIEILISAALLLGTSSLGLLSLNRQALLEVMRKDLESEEIAALGEARVLAAAARELGSALHGPVQSSILASAAALEKAVDGGDARKAHGELRAAAAAIDTALAGEANNDADVRARLQAITEPWTEMCTVCITECPDEVAILHGPTAEAIALVAREAIANAYRHGQATMVSVSLIPDGRHVNLRIVDDGVGVGPKAWGLGLTVIDSATRGHWTLTRNGDATVLAAKVPLD